MIILALSVIAISYGKKDNTMKQRKVAYNSSDIACIYLHRGMALGKKAMFKEGIEWYKQAIELNPDYSESYFCMGNAFRHMKSYGKAIESYKKVIDLEPGYDVAYFYLALSYLSIDAKEQAMEQYNVLKGKDRFLAKKLLKLI